MTSQANLIPQIATFQNLTSHFLLPPPPPHPPPLSPRQSLPHSLFFRLILFLSVNFFITPPFFLFLSFHQFPYHVPRSPPFSFFSSVSLSPPLFLFPFISFFLPVSLSPPLVLTRSLSFRHFLYHSTLSFPFYSFLFFLHPNSWYLFLSFLFIHLFFFLSYSFIYFSFFLSYPFIFLSFFLIHSFFFLSFLSIHFSFFLSYSFIFLSFFLIHSFFFLSFLFIHFSFFLSYSFIFLSFLFIHFSFFLIHSFFFLSFFLSFPCIFNITQSYFLLIASINPAQYILTFMYTVSFYFPSFLFFTSQDQILFLLTPTPFF
ncbi:unnamed protein product [Acanthosepion pharaonis]|uniref:Uncharacterized protein n=1 Tax=Acanthosepion pharaonis TaxID=158019 RepID=A0A812CCJ8_ACAPH|nr:unnamed protein product [Sepia pharaonis]